MQEIVLYGVLLTLALYYYTQNYSLLAVNCYKVGSKLKLRLYATRIVYTQLLSLQVSCTLSHLAQFCNDLHAEFCTNQMLLYQCNQGHFCMGWMYWHQTRLRGKNDHTISNSKLRIILTCGRSASCLGWTCFPGPGRTFSQEGTSSLPSLDGRPSRTAALPAIDFLLLFLVDTHHV